jgi:hypothetical protein
MNNTSTPNIFSANPVKHYRREIATTPQTTCGSRLSTKIDQLIQPNGTINNTSASTIIGLVNTVDYVSPNTGFNFVETCDKNMLSPTANARRRVRSSGMINRNVNTSQDRTTGQKYYTSTSQYLTSRNNTFKQNQYNYIKEGNPLAKPGSSSSTENIYSSQGTTKCKPMRVTQTTGFSYIWNNKSFDVVIETGYYTIDDISRIFKQTMFANNHYIISGDASSYRAYYNENIVFGLSIEYDYMLNKVRLHSKKIHTSEFPNHSYAYSIDDDGNRILSSHVIPTNDHSATCMQFEFNDEYFKSIIGFTQNVRTFPSDEFVNSVQNNFTVDADVSTFIQSIYKESYYKPNNHQFAQQGATSSSDLISRKKYNIITNLSGTYRTSDGLLVSNALAYGVPSNGYTVKDKYGYPAKCTPTFTKFSDEMKTCTVSKISNSI